MTSKIGREDKMRIGFPILFRNNAEGQKSFAEAPSEIHIVPTGKWNHPGYGEIEITPEDIAEIVKNFNDKVRRDIPITAGHDNGMSGGELPAIGWFTDLVDRGVNGLWGGVKWTEEGQALLAKGAFKYFSAELEMGYIDPQSGKSYGYVLSGGALTNKPYFKELKAVASFSEPKIINQFFNENNNNMDLNTILAKKAEELSAEEKSFVRDHKSELSAEQVTAFASVLDEGGETAEEKAAREASEKKAQEDANIAAGLNTDGTPKEPVAGGEGGGTEVKMSEAEVRALRAKADAGQMAFNELAKMKAEKIAGELVFSQTNAAGRFLPKQKDALSAFVFSLTEKQRDQFANLVNNMPKGLEFKEIGAGGGSELNVSKKVEEAVAAKIKASDNKFTYSQALKAVFSENPELRKEYEDSMIS